MRGALINLKVYKQKYQRFIMEKGGGIE